MAQSGHNKQKRDDNCAFVLIFHLIEKADQSKKERKHVVFIGSPGFHAIRQVRLAGYL